MRQSATEEAPFYKCKFCSELLPCSNKEADKLKIRQHLKNHKIKKEDKKEGHSPKKRKQKQRINKELSQFIVDSDSEEDEDQKESKTMKRSSFQCNLCNKLMPCKNNEDKKKIQYHLNSHRKRQREMDERNDKRDLSELICKICFKKAKSWKGNGLVTDMERHMMINHGGPKICKHCRKTEFSSDKEFKDHELWCYSNSVPVECNQCGEKLANRVTLVAHRDSVHRGPFICDTCGKEYMSIRTLEDHRRIHLGTEFVCEVKHCGRKFTTQASLKDHVDKAHLNIRPFECETCNKCFTTKVLLKSHQQIHSDVLGHICPYCGKGYKQSAVLYRHKLSCPMNIGKS